MDFLKYATLTCTVSFLCSCATIIEGSSQVINLTTTPIGADCVVTRDAELIGRVTTPGNFNIDKSKHDIQVVCIKDGYDDAVFKIKSGNTIAGIGNIVVGFGVGFIIDSVAGSDNHYDTRVSISLTNKAGKRPSQKVKIKRDKRGS